METDKERYLSMKKDRVLIMGAAGRDFHNFNVYFRGNEAYEVVAFTATQITNIKEESTLQNWPVLATLTASPFTRKAN
jgi:predicted GTPase